MMTIWPAPAKLNLFMYITGRRLDGYHNLQTLFQFIDYSDLIEIKVNDSGHINLITKLIDIPKENNLIVKAAKLLKLAAKKYLLINSGATISIRKKLPIGSGLGSGSSNAATILVALNYLWKTKFTINQLAELGLQLGADVPLFIHGYSAFAEGVGEKLRRVNIKQKWYLITYPNININTSDIFSSNNLTRNTKYCNMNQLLKLPFTNDCENLVRSNFVEIDSIISSLSRYAPTRLTGTGSCVFSECNNKQDAYDLMKLIPKYAVGFIAKGINMSPLHTVLSRIIHTTS
ncbi:4-(cytidine 5'-diphospho)-2-C-methyl-D-erythritol kinase [Candidatus Pantoea edessiphila]|uniref:4-diphosphocytidyl-2-C-methyl-D-erythritol kinase n=1 Tax=Candidatus Pantoea edessiphila TaxID=2044610 RepID=A0A2P5SWY9_9GAMM|nr:4-(cytidine 5'-diphospho)-2-C-methyl-D-erythritol kinase [Candidatus Pantoea edessiphila]PPI86822.1 4-(cytidine 5'-diphospho)-2-C-methyl-D-erythritol kinase [Candidatus Pantoea edessiphila]